MKSTPAIKKNLINFSYNYRNNNYHGIRCQIPSIKYFLNNVLKNKIRLNTMLPFIYNHTIMI